MFMRKAFTILLIIAFGVTTILPRGYASEDNLRPFATGLLLGGKVDQTPVQSDSRLPANPAIIQKTSRKLLPVISTAMLLLLNGCKKKQGLSLKMKLIIAGAFIGTFALLWICYKFSDERKKIEETGSYGALTRWKRGAPWVIIIGSILSILAYIFSNDETALAYIPLVVILTQVNKENTFLGPKAESLGPDITGPEPKTVAADRDLEIGRLLVEPLIIQIEEQLKNNDMVPESFSMSLEAKSISAAGRFESISVDSQDINRVPKVIPINQGQRVLTAIAGQA